MADIDADELRATLARFQPPLSHGKTSTIPTAALRELCDAARAYLSLRTKADSMRGVETEEQAAERELGAWLVEHPGWTWCLIEHTECQVGLQHYNGAQAWGLFEPTKSAAIRSALKAAKERG